MIGIVRGRNQERKVFSFLFFVIKGFGVRFGGWGGG